MIATVSLAAVLVGAGVCLVLAVRSRRRSSAVAIAAWCAAAGALAALFLSGMRHYGPTQVVGTDSRVSACAQWFRQIDSRHGVHDDGGRGATACHQAAVDAIGPAIGEAAGAGVAIGGIAFGLIVVSRRRRPNDRARRVTADRVLA